MGFTYSLVPADVTDVLILPTNNLSFTGSQSFFSRKDSIRTIYSSLNNELKKVITGGRHAQPGSASYLEDLLQHLSEQLCHFTQARTEMADLYEKMYLLGSQKNINSEELVATLEAVLHKYSSKSVLCIYLFIK